MTLIAQVKTEYTAYKSGQGREPAVCWPFLNSLHRSPAMAFSRTLTFIVSKVSDQPCPGSQRRERSGHPNSISAFLNTDHQLPRDPARDKGCKRKLIGESDL